MKLADTPKPSHALRTAAWMEGSTLLALIGIAVPAKHLFGFPVVVTIMGPVHGLAFLYYLWQVSNCAASEEWCASKIFRAVVCALVPFGALANLLAVERNRRMIEVACDQSIRGS